MITTKKHNFSDNIMPIIILLTFILAFPLFISFILAKTLISVLMKKSPRRILISLILLMVISVSLYIFYLVFASPSSLISIKIYDWFLPVSTQGKIIYNQLLYPTDWTSEIIVMLMCSLTSGLSITIITLPLRPLIKTLYISNIEEYQSKLNQGDISLNPVKDKSITMRIIHFFYSITDKEIYMKIHAIPTNNKLPENHIMLDKYHGIPIKHLNKHLAIIGTTGSGKTETTFKFIEDSIKREKPTILVDGKGDIDNIFKIKHLAEQNNRKLYIFTLSGKEIGFNDKVIKPNQYNPFKSTNESSLVDLVMALFDFSEEHYKAGARVYMDILVKTLIETNIEINWENILYYMNKQKLEALLKKRYNIEPAIKSDEKDEQKIKLSIAQNENNKPETQSFKNYSIDKNQLENIDPRAISGFSGRLGMFYNTTRETITSSGFTLEDVFHNNGVAVFSLNSLDYQVQASSIGKLIVNNIKASAEKNALLGKKTTIALDEFNVFASESVIDILNKTRSKGYEMILSFQSIADLSKVSIDFRNQIIENTNSKIIHKTNDPQGAQYLASVLGTIKTRSKTFSADENDPNGRQTIKVANQFIAEADELKNLKIGEVYAKYTTEKGLPFVTPQKIKVLLNKRVT